MHLTPHEADRLLVAAAADLARRRLARGARLGVTEAIGLIVDEIHELAWDGWPLADVQRRAGRILIPDDVLPGVAEMVRVIQVDALFPGGTFLVSVPDPIRSEQTREATTVAAQRSINVGAPRRSVAVQNWSDQVIRVTSHVDFALVNAALELDRGRSRGWRLDIPAGSSVAWQPGEAKTVDLVPVTSYR